MCFFLNNTNNIWYNQQTSHIDRVGRPLSGAAQLGLLSGWVYALCLGFCAVETWSSIRMTRKRKENGINRLESSKRCVRVCFCLWISVCELI